jgi:hypothetical protein
MRGVAVRAARIPLAKTCRASLVTLVIDKVELGELDCVIDTRRRTETDWRKERDTETCCSISQCGAPDGPPCLITTHASLALRKP